MFQVKSRFSEKMILMLAVLIFMLACNKKTKDISKATSSDLRQLVSSMKEGRPIHLYNKDYYLPNSWQAPTINKKLEIYGHGARIIGPSGKAFFYSSGDVLMDSLSVIDFSTAVSILKGSDSILLNISNCLFQNNIAGIYVGGTKKIEGNIANNIFQGDLNRSTRAIYINADAISYLNIEKNTIDGYQHYGINVQGGKVDNRDRKNIKISGNNISNINNRYNIERTKQNVIGIKIDGWAPIIQDNVISNINGKFTDDREGIYTKAAYAKILNNRLTDAGVNEGYVAIKGKREGQGMPEGHHVTVYGNSFIETRGRKNHFLRIANEDVLIENNTFLNGYQGIHTNPSAAGDSIVIKENVFEGITVSCINFHLSDSQKIDVTNNKFLNFGNAITFDRCHKISNIQIDKNSFINEIGSTKSGIVLNAPNIQISVDDIHIFNNKFENLRHALYIKSGGYGSLYTEENTMTKIVQKEVYRAKTTKVRQHLKSSHRKNK